MVVWPANVDSSKSRKEGRKLTKAAGVQAPRLEEISDAATRLSLEAEIVPAKSRPSTWWEKGGYAILPKKGVKANLLRSIATEIKKARSAKTVKEKER
ncbi:MAG: signal recognition particle subunit SRP19/SEC65 family protein [Terriglobia bacterium]